MYVYKFQYLWLLPNVVVNDGVNRVVEYDFSFNNDG